MKKLSSSELTNYEGGVCYDFQRTPIHECASICFFGAIDDFNIALLVAFVTGEVVCIL